MASNTTECLGCGQKLKQKDTSIQCTVCGLWVHKSCSGVTNELFKTLADMFKETGKAYWACRSCTSYAEGMNHRLKQIEQKAAEAVKIGEENAKEIRNLKKELSKKNEQMEKRVLGGEESLMDEMNERERRRKNVVIYGMKESKRAEGRQRMEDDKKGLNSIFELTDVNISVEEDIEFCRRVGPRGDGERPLVCGFFTEWAKNTLLKHAKRLDGTELSGVSIAPDLTKMQRKAESELEQEATRKNEELTQDDMAKNLVWQVVGKKGQRRLIKAVKRDYERGRGGRGARGAERGRGMETRKRQREETENERYRNQPAKRGHRGRGRPLLTGSNRARLGIRLLGDRSDQGQSQSAPEMDVEQESEEETEEDNPEETPLEEEEGLQVGR